MNVNNYFRKTTKTTVVARLLLAIIICYTAFFGYLFINDQTRAINSNIADIENQILEMSAISARNAKKKEPVYINLPGATPIRAIVDDYSRPDSIWALVNKTNSLPLDYIPTDIIIPGVSTRNDKSKDERSVRSDIEKPLFDMFSDASEAGYELMIGSGYRSAALQSMYFNNLASSIGEDAANQAIARPGQSEHQTGLAVDITTVSRSCYLDNCFADTNDGQWLLHNSYKYGFILRYPSGKESITQYQYESWHFRYVGTDLATALHESNLTLDEAWPYLQSAQDTLRKNGAID